MTKLLASILIIFTIYFYKSCNIVNAVDTAEPALVYSNQNWHFLDYYDNDEQICYLFSRKIDSFSNDKEERDAYITITFCNKSVQVSINIGYDIKGGSVATVSLDGVIYIFKQKENSRYLFLDKAYYDYKILKNLKTAKSILIFSESKHHTYAVDVFSIKGFQEAYKTLSQKCRNTTH